MPFCPECKYEYVETVRRCPDCDVDLVDRLSEEPAAPARPLGKFVPVFMAKSMVEASIVKGMLESTDIPVIINLHRDVPQARQASSVIFGDLDGRIPLSVPESMADNARHVIDEALKSGPESDAESESGIDVDYDYSEDAEEENDEDDGGWLKPRDSNTL